MMLSTCFEACCTRHPHRDFLIHGDRSWTYHQSREAARNLECGIRSARLTRALVYLPDSPEIVHLLIAAESAGVELAIASPYWGLTEVAVAAKTAGCTEVILRERTPDLPLNQHLFSDLAVCNRESSDPETPLGWGGDSAQTPYVLIFTTGTTDEPKVAKYLWRDLLSQSRRRVDQEFGRWGLLYQMNHFAGFQMLGHVLSNDGTLVIIPNRDLDQVANAFRRNLVSCVSATPTFWRMFLGHVHDEFPDMRQITLGGEVATQSLLDAIRTRFPKAVVTHVYATTELGSCFSVSDGLAGFPVSLLDDHERAVQLKVVDGELHVRSRHGMRAYVGREHEVTEWVPTGDLVEVAGTRCYFRGRKSEVINVGGVKVQPAEIEEIIQSIPGVQMARVFGQPNAISGFLVAVDIVPTPGFNVAELESNVREKCRERLDRYKQPRLFRVCNELPTSNYKISRRDKTT